MKRILLLSLAFIMILCSGYRRPDKYVINAGNDAFLHNNIGLNYLNDRIYYAAIQEFKIAIQLSPNSQATAIFRTNLGKTYEYIGYPDMARICYEDALKSYGLNLQYYINLANCYIQLNITDSKIKELRASNLNYDKILLGLLYMKTGKKQMGIVTLDEFCIKEPDLMITPAIMQFIKENNTINSLPNF